VRPKSGQAGQATTPARSPLDREGILDSPARIFVPKLGLDGQANAEMQIDLEF
jgi:hypothetical protein